MRDEVKKPERPVWERNELYKAVLELRSLGLSYGEIIDSVEQKFGIRLSKSHIHYWVRGLHRPFGSVREFDGKPSPELAHIIGVAKGDAALDVQRWNYRIRLRVTDRDFAEEFNRCISVVLNCPPHRPTWIESRRQWCVDVSSVLLYRFLRQPLNRLYGTIEHCDGCVGMFLRGFADSEGSVSGRSLTFSNTDRQLLAYCSKLLTRRIGIDTTFPRLQRKKGALVFIRGRLYTARKDCYEITVRAKALEAFQSRVNFAIDRKAASLRGALFWN